MINLAIGVASSVCVNPFLLLAICNVETGLKNINNYQDHNGVSYGVSQIKIATAKGVDPNISISDLENPRRNLTVAAKHLKQLMKRYKDYRLASAAYNAGSLRYSDGHLINKEYVNKVMTNYYAYQKRFCLLRGKNDKNKIQDGKGTAYFCSSDTM